MGAQTDLSFRWEQMSLGTFSNVAAYFIKTIFARFQGNALEVHIVRKWRLCQIRAAAAKINHAT